MTYNPYTAQRSTTPPLYYRRPEGLAQSYYAVPAQREVPSLHIQGYPTASMNAARQDERSLGAPPAPQQHTQPPQAHTMPASTATPHGAYGGYFANPFPCAAPAPQQTPNGHADHFRSSDGGVYGAAPVGAAPGRWSYQQPSRHDEDGRRAVQLEAEEAAFGAEEAALKARKTELLSVRRRQEEEQLRLSEGWAALLEREERYYTEPVPDYSQDIAAREHQCAALHERLQQAEAHHAYLAAQVGNHEYVVRDAAATEQEMSRVREGLAGVEQRRRACIARAERFFDVETKRGVEAGRAARRLDGQLRDMTRSGPLAHLQRDGSSSRSQSRCVTFLPGDKSVVIDLGRGDSLSTSASVEPARTDLHGLSQDEESSGSINGGRRFPYKAAGNNIGGRSVCLGLEDEEMGIGGTSVAFSLNSSTADAIGKRRRMEMTF